MSKPKKKRSTVDILTDYGNRIGAEARTSVSLDGETQHCNGCSGEFDKKHTCGLAPMTAEERAVVEAAEKLREWRMSPKGDPFPLSRPELDVIHAVAALRAARGK